MKLPAFNKAKVLVAGDLMLDRYWTGQVGRISPEAPVPVVKIVGSEDRLGGAANVAANCAALGCKTQLIGWVGADEAGDRIKRLLSGSGVKARVRTHSSLQTITKLRVMAQQQQLMRLDFESQEAAQTKAILASQLSASIRSCNVVVMSDYSKGALQQSASLIDDVVKAGLPVLVDPKGLNFGKYRGATLLKPNLQEFQAVVGDCPDEATLISKSKKLLSQLGMGSILITRGAKGMTWVGRTSSTHIPVKSLDVFDVTGAGDTVIATVAACLGAGSTLLDAIHWANLAASIAVSKVGTSTVSGVELLRHSAANSSTLEKIVGSTRELNQKWAEWKAAGQKIVMTNGVFDLLHAGHIEYLERARSLGDRLVIAVNGDASTRRLKGPSRPIVPLEARMRMLAALSCVDAVISFDTKTPEKLYAALIPDLLVKGGDYEIHQIAGAQAVQKAGGQVKVMPFKEGYSSSQLISQVLKRAGSQG